MKKIKFYILFSEELNRPYTSFQDYCENKQKTFTLMKKDSYDTELIMVRVFPSEKLAQIEKNTVLEQMKTNNQYCIDSKIEIGHTEENIKLIENLQIVEMSN